MEHQSLADWHVYQSRIKDMKIIETELYHISDSKIVQMAEIIWELKKEGKPYYDLDMKLRAEERKMLDRTRVFLKRKPEEIVVKVEKTVGNYGNTD